MVVCGSRLPSGDRAAIDLTVVMYMAYSVLSTLIPQSSHLPPGMVGNYKASDRSWYSN